MYPFERFSEDAKAVLTLSQAEAERAGHSYIGTEHLLLGLMRREQAMAAIALKAMGLQFGEVEAAIQAILQNPPPAHGLKELIPTSRVKRVIEMAFEEARRDNLSRVETGHLLIGLLAEGEGIAAHVLVDRGVTVERARAELLGLRGAGKAETQGAGPPPTRRHLALTDGNGKPIAIDVIFPAEYSPEQQDALLRRIHAAVEGKGHPG